MGKLCADKSKLQIASRACKWKSVSVVSVDSGATVSVKKIIVINLNKIKVIKIYNNKPWLIICNVKDEICSSVQCHSLIDICFTQHVSLLVSTFLVKYINQFLVSSLPTLVHSVTLTVSVYSMELGELGVSLVAMWWALRQQAFFTVWCSKAFGYSVSTKNIINSSSSF